MPKLPTTLTVEYRDGRIADAAFTVRATDDTGYTVVASPDDLGLVGRAAIGLWFLRHAKDFGVEVRYLNSLHENDPLGTDEEIREAVSGVCPPVAEAACDVHGRDC